VLQCAVPLVHYWGTFCRLLVSFLPTPQGGTDNGNKSRTGWHRRGGGGKPQGEGGLVHKQSPATSNLFAFGKISERLVVPTVWLWKAELEKGGNYQAICRGL
jgi:hypothetical protein